MRKNTIITEFENKCILYPRKTLFLRLFTRYFLVIGIILDALNILNYSVASNYRIEFKLILCAITFFSLLIKYFARTNLLLLNKKGFVLSIVTYVYAVFSYVVIGLVAADPTGLLVAAEIGIICILFTIYMFKRKSLFGI